jgi:hypothetical protein
MTTISLRQFFVLLRSSVSRFVESLSSRQNPVYHIVLASQPPPLARSPIRTAVYTAPALGEYTAAIALFGIKHCGRTSKEKCVMPASSQRTYPVGELDVRPVLTRRFKPRLPITTSGNI